MTTSAQPASRAGCLRGLLIILTAFLGLCTLFVGAITIVQALQERNQQRWPDATAYVVRAEMARSSYRGRHKLYIRCRLSFTANSKPVTATVYSRYVPGPEVAQYPANQAGPYQDWVATHPAGTPIAIRYNPSNPTKVVTPNDPLLSTSAHTPQNLELLAAVVTAFLILFGITYALRPRTI